MTPDHYVTFTRVGYHVDHPPDCRMHGNCAYTRALGRIRDLDAPMADRWRIVRIDSEGLPELERQEDLRDT